MYIAFSFHRKEELIRRLLESNITVEDALSEENLRLASYAKEECPVQYIQLKLKYKKLGISNRDLEDCFQSAAGQKMPAHADFFGGLQLKGIDTAGLKLPDGYEMTMSGLSHMSMTKKGPQIIFDSATPFLITKKIEDITDGSEKLELSFLRK